MFGAEFLHALPDAGDELLGYCDVIRRLKFRRNEVGERGGVIGTDGGVEGHRLVALAPPPIPVAVPGQIGRDLVQPGRKRRIAAEIGQTAMGADKGVLGHLFGVLLVAQELVGHRINAVPIPVSIR